MTTGTVAALILAALVAGGLVFFQYFYKAGNTGSVRRVLALLRFIAIFGLLALLINPVITRNTYQTEKIPLPVILDNSGSIKELGADKTAMESFETVAKNSALADKFAVETFQFDEELTPFEKADFTGRQSNPDAVAKALRGLYRNHQYPAILITDGNQTQGADYVHSFGQAKVFALAVGDTVQHPDLKITRLNVNKYAFLKNQFPVEVFLSYSGEGSLSAQFAISQGGSALVKQPVSFSPGERTKTLNLLLPAEKSGVQQYTAVISSSLEEKNKYNNFKRFAVEVMDQKTEVALVASINHPDLGAIRRSIEANAQRKATIVKPNELKDLSKYNVLIFYQPNGSFKPVYELNKQAGINTFTITGMATDYDFLNREQTVLSFRNSGQPEDYQAAFEANFNLFALDDIGFNRFPPLEQPYGAISVKENVNTLLSSTIRNIPTEAPLLTFTESQNRRHAYLLGENIWKWRMHLHSQESSFEKFDVFLDKTIQFLATTAIRKSLVVNHERFYNSGDAIEITAQYFNKNFEFDQGARLTMTVTNKNTKQSRKYDMLKGSNVFRANLDGLTAGTYQLSVRELNSNAVYNGGFEVLDFDIEKQFVNADWQRLKQLADVTGGKAAVASQVSDVIKILLDDQHYKPIQKKVSQKSPLIEWYWLLFIIAVALGGEWFIRKYNGML